MMSTDPKVLANKTFKQEARDVQGVEAAAEREAAAQAIRDKTERLKALRLEKEAAESAQEAIPTRPMTTEHIEALEELRRQTVEQRRRLVRDLAAPWERGGAQDVREMFIKIQTTFEAIDQALEDERRLQIER